MSDLPPPATGCERCAHLCQQFAIRAPSDLEHALRVVRDNLADGTIREMIPDPARASPSFASIAPQGPWDDVLDFTFRCPGCGQRFSLTAETFHGSGGEWRPLSSQGPP